MYNAQFALPKLQYGLSDLEPYISGKTLDLHYNQHHQTYIKNLNNLLLERGWVMHDLDYIIMQTFKKIDEVAIFNNAGQVWNHNFYWNSIISNGGSIPSGKLIGQIEKDFGSFIAFRDIFIKEGLTQFGSGWVWLVWNIKEQKLEVFKTSNAEMPMLYNKIALLTSDVWEHAYYLDYQNRRAEYLQIFVDKLLNWKFAEENFQSIIKKGI